MTELDSTILAMSMVVTAMQVEVDDWANHLDDEPTDGMKVGYDWYYSTLDICKRALALLRDQKPHLYTIDEIQKAEDMACWYEYWYDEKNTTIMLCMKDDVTRKTDEENGFFPFGEPYDVLFDTGLGVEYNVNYRDYNKEWRCWTSKPTAEERQEVPWDD